MNRNNSKGLPQLPLALAYWGPLDEKIWNYLKEHARGRNRAVSRKEIASAFELDVREVSAKIKDLIEIHGKIIGTDSAGVWIPATEEEAKAAQENIRHRFISLAKRYQSLKKLSDEEFSRQLLLWLKEGSHRE